jgi:flavin-dependent dehydrogenase
MALDVAIAGAGSAGAALAAMAARAGMRVACVDRRPLDRAGARWVNGVPRWMFEEAGLHSPRGDELAGAGHAFHLVAGWGPDRVVVRGHDVLDVDMRSLVARLQRDATDAGADLRGGVTVHAIEAGALATSAGTLRARFIVDASGLAGARLLGQQHIAPGDLCAAAMEVREVRDAAGARAFLDAQRAAPGDTVCFSAVAGGYSIVSARVDGDRVSLLTGSLSGLGHPSGAKLLASFAEKHTWIGARVFGGARAIPLRAPGVLASGNVALIGDAACQVFATHGSGVGVGLVAARILATSLARGEGPEGYAAAFDRRFRAVLRASDVFRRLSQRLSARQVAWLMRRGWMDESRVRAGLEQRVPSLRGLLR